MLRCVRHKKSAYLSLVLRVCVWVFKILRKYHVSFSNRGWEERVES